MSTQLYIKVVLADVLEGADNIHFRQKAGPTTLAFSIVGHWFRVRRGLALGFVTVGAAFGGIFYSLLLKACSNSCRGGMRS